MTTIVVTLLKSYLSLIVVNAMLVASNHPKDSKYYIGAILAIVVGFTMRVMVDIKANTFTWKNACIQAVLSICLCYLCVLAYEDIAPKLRIEYYLVACSFCSLFITSVVEKTVKHIVTDGGRELARILLKRLTASDPNPNSDVKPQQEEKP